MSNSNSALVHQLYERFGRQDLAAATELIADDFEWQVMPFGQRFVGRAGFAESFNNFAVPFAGARIDVKQTIACEDTVVVEYDFIATHTGELMTPAGPLPPTGRDVNLPGCELYTMRDGKITRLHTYFDAATMMQQLGILGQPQGGD